MKVSVVIPAHNEEQNIGPCLTELADVVGEKAGLDYELLVVNDCSTDGTEQVVRERMRTNSNIRIINRTAPPGFGRAVRSGLAAVSGDVVVIYMADASDDPADVVAYCRKIAEGYDCVFGSRFVPGAHVEKYPWGKLICNRLVNHMIRWLFWTPFNDLTNAFKAYRTSVVRECGPFRASHFNITIEMSLSALIRRYEICEIPIRWSGRTWGSSKLRIWHMGRRYLSTLAMMFFQRYLIVDDLIAERLARKAWEEQQGSSLAERVKQLEQRVDDLDWNHSAAERQPPPVVENLPDDVARLGNG